MVVISTGVFVMAGAVMAGLITGAVSLISLIISKEHTISEYRESRRLRVREETAQFLAEIDTLFYLYESELKSEGGLEEFNHKQLASFREKNKSHLYHLNEMRNRIYLRATGEKSEELRSLILKIEEVFYGNKASKKELEILRNQIIELTHYRLKKDWNKIKTGEHSYKLAKKIAKFFTLFSMGLVSLIFYSILIYFFKTNENDNDNPHNLSMAVTTKVPIDCPNSPIISDLEKLLEKALNSNIVYINNTIDRQSQEYNQHLDRHLKILATRSANHDCELSSNLFKRTR